MLSRCALAMVIAWSGAWAKDVSSLYDAATLEYWKTRYEKSTQKILDTVILPVLTAEERQKLRNARLDFPLYSEFDKANPLSFYAPGDGRVVMPVLSLKFLDDLCTAYAWLQVNGYGLETISEYTAMLAYKDFPSGRYPPPLPALHIPATALNDRRVDELALGHFVTARTFLLLHELGHIYYDHRWVTTKQSRANEAQADEFAAKVMRRTPLPPLGMLVFFMADAHWSAFPVGYTEQQWQEYLRQTRTHPLTGERLHTLARALADPELAALLDQLATLLDDRDAQASIIATAKASDESMLSPRRPGELPRLASSATPRDRGARAAFDGKYVGHYVQNSDPRPFPVETALERQGSNVKGRYTFGLGVGQIEGSVDGDTLNGRWEWSGNYGRATLRASHDGASFSGTWGYRESATNAGTWTGDRAR